MNLIKCNKCGLVADESKFRHGRDFFQNPFVSGCPSCDNSQSPGDASMRMFGGKRPFEKVEDLKSIQVTDRESALRETLRRANEIS